MTQSYRCLQIIAVDDGSTDRSGMILDRLSKEDERILVLHQENRGTAVARNSALEAATGTYLTFVDSDDYISPHYIKHFVRKMQESGASLLICGARFVTEKGRVLKKLIPDSYVRFEAEEWPMRISAVMGHFYRRELWTQSQLHFDEHREIMEDVAISIYFAAVCDKIDVLPEAGYYYVMRKSSSTHQVRQRHPKGSSNRTLSLPYHSLENALKAVRDHGVVNSQEFHEIFVLRTLAVCAFDLSKKIDKAERRRLWRYICHIIRQYIPGSLHNRRAGLFADTRFPFVQRVGVCALLFLVRIHFMRAENKHDRS